MEHLKEEKEIQKIVDDVFLLVEHKYHPYMIYVKAMDLDHMAQATIVAAYFAHRYSHKEVSDLLDGFEQFKRRFS